eukprot:1160601-Pelagomonas_calceolata.AAC.3
MYQIHLHLSSVHEVDAHVIKGIAQLLVCLRLSVLLAPGIARSRRKSMLLMCRTIASTRGANNSYTTAQANHNKLSRFAPLGSTRCWDIAMASLVFLVLTRSWCPAERTREVELIIKS